MAGLQFICRWCLSALIAAACLLFARTNAAAAEPAVWAKDHATAAAQARKQGKFLLVVHLSGDFTASEESDGGESEEARLYRTLALAEPRVAQLLQDRFVATYRHVGGSRSLVRLEPASGKSKSPAPARAATPAANLAIAYVCLPDERVLHYVPGYLSAGELLAELRWLETTYAASLRLSDADAPYFWRMQHQAKVAKSEWAEYVRLFPSRWMDDQLASGSSTVDLPPALEAARTTLAQSLAARVPGRSTSALASHGALGVDAAHLVLAEFPLLPLSDLARPVFESTAGQRFWETPARRKQLTDWWTECRRRNVASLLVVKDDFYQATADEGRIPSPGAPDFLDPSHMAARVVSLDELAQLLADANLDPIAYAAADGHLRYVLHDARGFRCAQLSDGEGTIERLKAAIRSAAGPAAIKGGGATEEEH